MSGSARRGRVGRRWARDHDPVRSSRLREVVPGTPGIKPSAQIGDVDTEYLREQRIGRAYSRADSRMALAPSKATAVHEAPFNR